MRALNGPASPTTRLEPPSSPTLTPTQMDTSPPMSAIDDAPPIETLQEGSDEACSEQVPVEEASEARTEALAEVALPNSSTSPIGPLNRVSLLTSPCLIGQLFGQGPAPAGRTTAWGMVAKAEATGGSCGSGCCVARDAVRLENSQAAGWGLTRGRRIGTAGAGA